MPAADFVRRREYSSLLGSSFGRARCYSFSSAQLRVPITIMGGGSGHGLEMLVVAGAGETLLFCDTNA